ncbi:uncharacterized MFS-type transporter C09D4.1-like isoform X1 [Diabrotica undecimpunctata]|uniref:uncharacterized MFS-type transporter C09D4.1-like isoform X1 n=1 Tax=Diabrotica undecimpunctata TaxID=50387 RepID=UPI003B63691D
MKMHPETEAAQDVEIKVFRYRWVQLIIFCLLGVINTMQFLQFTIVANVITEYYNVDSSLVDMTGLIFFIINIIFFLPISYLIERYSLRVTAIVSSVLTVAGLAVKILGNDPSRFYVLIIGQGLCALGQVYIFNIPTKFASTWFGPDEVSTACALAVLGTQLGSAIGAIIPPFMVVKGENKDETGDGIFDMTLYNAIAGVVILILVIVFFRARPKLPPSQSQLQLLTLDEEKSSFWKDCKLLMKDTNYILVLMSFGIINGLWNAFGIVINTFYITYFPNGETDIGIISLIAIISGGCVGSVIFGYILDKTHAFKTTSFVVAVCVSVTYIFNVLSMVLQIRVATYFAIPIFGFFTASTLLMAFEFAIELTYPIPESVSCSVVNAFIFLFAIIGTFIIETLIDAIGHVGTHITIFVIFVICTFMMLFIKGRLKRREANLSQGQTENGVIN